MQINPLLQNLVEQYYGSMESLPPDMTQFLQTVNNLFASVSIETGKGNTSAGPKETSLEANALSTQQVSLLQQYSSALSAADEEQHIYDMLIDFFSESFSSSSCRIYKPNPAGNDYQLVSYGFAAGAREIPENLQLVREAAAQQKPVTGISNSLENQTAQTFSELAVPIIFRGEILAVVSILSDEPDQITEQNLLLLEFIATQTGFALNSLNGRKEAAGRTHRMDPQVGDVSHSGNGPISIEDFSSLKLHQYSYDPNLRTAIPLEEGAEIPLERLPNKNLEVQGHVIGAFGLQTNEDELLTAEERQLLDSISEEVSQALERAQLLESSQRSAAELAVLNEMGNLFSEALDEETIINGLYTYSVKLIEAPHFYVAYYDEVNDTISFPKVILNGEPVTPDHPAADNFMTRPSGTGLTGYIIKHREPILIEENAEEVLGSLGIPYQKFGEQTQSWLGVPMTMGDLVLGVITIQSDTKPGLYNHHHLELLSTIASQAAVAINNIRLFEQEQERAEQERLVRTIKDKVRRGNSTEAILQIALEELSKVLNAETSTIQLGTPDQLIIPHPPEDPGTNSQPEVGSPMNGGSLGGSEYSYEEEV